MSKYKHSELEKQIQEIKESDKVDKYYLYSQMIADITEDDETATKLARKVLNNDISNILEKIQSLFQRETANCCKVKGKTNIDILIEWLEYINPDEF